ncbi:MAG: hypothetical protein IPI25_00010 [Candidatus Brocadia sp.]|nr:MAG: hypothetical protein IPI25_00010 [Candidatus Brocadia sp.]
MRIPEGTYQVNASSGKLFVYTFKEGFLSAIAHDLLIEVADFQVKLSFARRRHSTYQLWSDNSGLFIESNMCSERRTTPV